MKIESFVHILKHNNGDSANAQKISFDLEMYPIIIYKRKKMMTNHTLEALLYDIQLMNILWPCVKGVWFRYI